MVSAVGLSSVFFTVTGEMTRIEYFDIIVVFIFLKISYLPVRAAADPPVEICRQYHLYGPLRSSARDTPLPRILSSCRGVNLYLLHRHRYILDLWPPLIVLQHEILHREIVKILNIRIYYKFRRRIWFPFQHFFHHR